MPTRSVARSTHLIIIVAAVVCWTTVARAQKPEALDENEPAAEAGAELPEGFIASRVKADAPDEIRAFFEDSDKARLAAIATLYGKIDIVERKLKAAKRRRLKADESEPPANVTEADVTGPGRAIAALLKDVGYVTPFETVLRGDESKMLKSGLILRFGHPLKVVRVIDKDRALITVEEQHRGPKRRNSAGKMIEPIELKRVPAVVQTSTAGMKDGARTLIKMTLHVTGTETIDGATVFVLEPFPVADYLEE
jgi:hypothetical protein